MSILNSSNMHVAVAELRVWHATFNRTITVGENRYLINLIINLYAEPWPCSWQSMLQFWGSDALTDDSLQPMLIRRSHLSPAVRAYLKAGFGAVTRASGQPWGSRSRAGALRLKALASLRPGFRVGVMQVGKPTNICIFFNKNAFSIIKISQRRGSRCCM